MEVNQTDQKPQAPKYPPHDIQRILSQQKINLLLLDKSTWLRDQFTGFPTTTLSAQSNPLLTEVPMEELQEKM